MRYTAAAVTFAISTSLAAATATGDWDWRGEGQAKKSSKSSTKSSKSGGCTSCSAGTLTRANILTNLVYSSLSVDGVINEESVVAYCKADPDEKEAFLQALENTAGCLVDAQCFIQRFTEKVYFDINATITEGAFEATAINDLCKAEQKGVILPVGECNALDACDAINGGLLGSNPSDEFWYLGAIEAAIAELEVSGIERFFFRAGDIALVMKRKLPSSDLWNQGLFLQALKKGIVSGTITTYNWGGNLVYGR